jgi:KDO2-lipid IV(A) lauroyltransferase
MTLSARLALQTGATVLVAWGERLPWGRGYVVRVMPLPLELSRDMAQAAAQINQAMESLILQKPQQYLWGYARYKTPKATGP